MEGILPESHWQSCPGIVQVIGVIGEGHFKKKGAWNGGSKSRPRHSLGCLRWWLLSNKVNWKRNDDWEGKWRARTRTSLKMRLIGFKAKAQYWWGDWPQRRWEWPYWPRWQCITGRVGAWENIFFRETYLTGKSSCQGNDDKEIKHSRSARKMHNEWVYLWVMPLIKLNGIRP